jgi:hypothetical protein
MRRYLTEEKRLSMLADYVVVVEQIVKVGRGLQWDGGYSVAVNPAALVKSLLAEQPKLVTPAPAAAPEAAEPPQASTLA